MQVRTKRRFGGKLTLKMRHSMAYPLPSTTSISCPGWDKFTPICVVPPATFQNLSARFCREYTSEKHLTYLTLLPVVRLICRHVIDIAASTFRQSRMWARFPLSVRGRLQVFAVVEVISLHPVACHFFQDADVIVACDRKWVRSWGSRIRKSIQQGRMQRLHITTCAVFNEVNCNCKLLSPLQQSASEWLPVFTHLTSRISTATRRSIVGAL